MGALTRIALDVLAFAVIAALIALVVIGVIYAAAYATRATLDELRKAAEKEDE